MNVLSSYTMVSQSFLKPRELEQKSGDFNDALLNAKSSSNIKKPLNVGIDRSLKEFSQPVKKDFSYQTSAEVVSQRLNKKDFSIFMPPSINAYKN